MMSLAFSLKNYKMKSEKFLYIPIIALLVYWIVRLIDQSQMMSIFPIDAFANDYSSHMAKVFFLAKYGLYQIIPNWYNGTYVLLRFYPPAWYIFTLPLYYLTKNPQAAVFLSLCVMYILGFLLIQLLGKTQKISQVKRIAFFTFFFVNPIAIGYFLRLGKMPEMFGWLAVILLSTIILWYKDHKLDKKFLFFIPAYYLLFHAHMLVFIVASFLVLSLFLIKNIKEKIYITLSVIFTMLITAPSWLTFMQSLQSNVASGSTPLIWIATFTRSNMNDIMAAFVIPPIFLTIFYLYWKNKNKSKKELVFFSPLLLLSILYFTRLAIFIPLINRPHPDTYNFLFIFLSLFLLFKIKLSKLSSKTRNILVYSLTIVPLLGIILSVTITPFFVPYTQPVRDTFSLFEKVNGNVLILQSPPEVHQGAAYSYGAIYNDIKTPGGWEPINLTKEYIGKVSKPSYYLKQEDCNNLKDALDLIGVTNVVTYNNHCKTLEDCEFKEIASEKTACLYMTPDSFKE